MIPSLIAAAVLGVSMPSQTFRPPAGIDEPAAYELADRNEYRLGPGDIVTVVVTGGASGYLIGAGISPWAEYSVGGDGYLSVSGIGAVPVEGLTIEEAQMSLQRAASTYYPSIGVTLSLKEPRMLRVRVGGMVNSPGIYVLSALDRVSGALLKAGGISTYGSRRGRMYTEAGDTLAVDMNMVPGTMTSVSDPFLTDNAEILIDICRDPLYILTASGLMETRELEEGDNIRSLLDRMGGITGNVNFAGSILLSDGEREPLWTEAAGFSGRVLMPGDTVMIVTIRDSVVVGGAVSRPGRVPYNPESTVIDYVLYAGGPLSASGSRISVHRHGREVPFDGDVKTSSLMPGDVVNVGYSWFERNSAMLSLVTTAVSLGITLYVATR